VKHGTRADLLTLVLAVVLVATASVGVVVKDDDAQRATVEQTASDDGDTRPLGTDVLPGTAAPTGRTSTGAPGRSSSDATVVGPTASAAPGGVGVVPSRPATGPPIRVGVHIGDNEGAAAAFGVGGLPQIGREEINAVVRELNASGGLGGRTVEPVYHASDPLQGSFDAQGQRACAALVEDEKVAMIIDNALTPSPVLMECAAKKTIPYVWELHMMQITNAQAARLANVLYRPSMPNAERLGVVIESLFDAGFFKGAKVGIIRWDAPESKLITDKVFRPRLAAHKVPVVSQYVTSKAAGAGGATTLSGQSSNAVLQFREDGVTHVLFVPTGGAIPLVFLPQAATQGWYPKYALSTQDAPEFISENNPPSQLEGSMAVGWGPAIDGHGAAMTTSAFARCRKSVTDAGLAWDESVEPYCDAFYFLQRALHGASSVTPRTLRAGAEAIGTSHRSPYVFGTRFGPGRHDGPAQARVMRFDVGAGRFRYTGPRIAF
jgi:hypothetical protein